MPNQKKIVRALIVSLSGLVAACGAHVETTSEGTGGSHGTGGGGASGYVWPSGACSPMAPTCAQPNAEHVVCGMSACNYDAGACEPAYNGAGVPCHRFATPDGGAIIGWGECNGAGECVPDCARETPPTPCSTDSDCPSPLFRTCDPVYHECIVPAAAGGLCT